MNYSMIKKMLYLSIISSLIAASVISINVNMFQLSIFRILIITITFFVLIDMLLTKKSFLIKKGKKNYYSIKFMAIWLFYAFFSLAWVKDYNSWIKSVYFIGLGFLCVIIFSKYLETEYDVLISFKLISIMIIFHNLIGWYEIVTGNYMFLSSQHRISKYMTNNYPVSMFNNTNDFATFMLFSVFITYICLINTKNSIIKIIYGAIIISSIQLLILTESRANILGLILAFIIFSYFSIHKRKTRHIMIVLLSTIFIVVLVKPEIIANIFYTVNKKLYFNFTGQTGSDIIRLNLIKNGFTFLIRTFGFGTGAGNIEYWMKNYAVYNTWGTLNIHNWWMEILTGYGWIIFLMYTIFYIKLFLSNYKKFRESNDKVNISISLGIMCCMAGYVVGSISSSSNINSEWLWVFWAIVIAYQGMNSFIESSIRIEKLIN